MSGRKVIKQPTGTWKASYSTGSGPNRVRRSKILTTRNAAIEWLNELSVRYEKGNGVRRRLTLCEYYEYWLNLEKSQASKLELNTLDSYQMTGKRLKKVLPHVKLEDVDRPMVQSAFNVLGVNHAHATLMKDLGHLRAMFRSAIRNGDLNINVCEDIVIAGNNQGEKTRGKKFMPVDDLRAIQNDLRSEVNSLAQVNRFVLFICSISGLRVGECLALTKSDIDEDNSVLRVRSSYDSAHRMVKSTKNSQSIREVPIDGESMMIILEWLNKHDSWLMDERISNPQSFIFLNKNGVLPVANSINATFKALQRKLGMAGKYSVHSFRSTLASLMVERGVPIEYVARYLGHTPSSAVTRRYYVDVLPSAIGNRCCS
ncbi:tyrosine-type recombinase/integrase [Liquorilactobacillus hordei]|uniref:tyrosine-type recombinase/integrase n=1 Tax=Liquorilactobacillus hordei TaxID=468911 RepID=UPI001CBACCF0|nr:site-specific integrase [Liquorilactobacillus hordei]MBZ2405780.1 hypothetical protein [Liquorilactobacillus hordei]